jgi:hypothetical protein
MSSYETYLWEEAGGTTIYSLTLGDDYDCETCGITYNEAELEVNADNLVFSYRVGCYSGDTINILHQDFDLALEKAIETLKNFSNWNKEFENKVKEEVNNWYTMSAIKEIRDWKMGK